MKRIFRASRDSRSITRQPTRPAEYRGQMALDLARAALAEQDRALEAYRTKALAVISVAAVVAGVVNGQLTKTEATLAALLGAALSLAAATVLWPRSFGSGVSARMILDDPGWRNLEPADYSSALARHLEDTRAGRERRLDLVGYAFLVELVLAAAVVGVLLTATGGTL